MILGAEVRVFGIRPELLLALVVADELYHKKDETLIIYHLMDGEHMKGSLHYVGSAGDLSVPQLSNPLAMVTDLRAALGSDYDVVYETTHIHIEFQPKEHYGHGSTD